MKYSWIEIDLQAIADNYCSVQQLTGGTEIMAVVKANAYGLGAVPIAKKLEKAGCRHFAVTFFEEAVELRDAGIEGQILVMMPIEPEEALEAVKLHLTTAMGDVHHARRVSRVLAACNSELPVHIKTDSGLSRMGIVLKGRLEEAVHEAQEIAALPGLRAEGVFTHLTAANPNGEYAWLDNWELDLFNSFVEKLNEGGLHLKKHSLCSDPLLYHKSDNSDYIRIGTLLYGVHPEKYGKFHLKNALTLKSRIVQVKDIPADTPISYGPLFVTSEAIRVAIVPIGFADGIRRILSNVGQMVVHGRRVPIVGKICCDHTILDVTSLPELQEGDIVTVFGTDGSETQFAGEYARLCKASEPEITSILSHRIPRSYLNP